MKTTYSKSLMEGTARSLFKPVNETREHDPDGRKAVPRIRRSADCLLSYTSKKAGREHGRESNRESHQRAQAKLELPSPGLGQESASISGVQKNEGEPGARASSQAAPAGRTKPLPQAPQSGQADLIGGKHKTAQALHDERLRRDAKRNSGQELGETTTRTA
jgi:hypothetical protein